MTRLVDAELVEPAVRGLLDFYNDYGLSVPGREPSKFTYVFVSHDMNHVIADHLSMADWPLTDVRALYGVPPL